MPSLKRLFKNIMANAAVAIKNPEDYEARSNLMWGATLALNGIMGLGKKQDWMAHQIEHALSAFYDIPHGAGLAIVHPMLLRYIYKIIYLVLFALLKMYGVSAKTNTPTKPPWPWPVSMRCALISNPSGLPQLLPKWVFRLKRCLRLLKNLTDIRHPIPTLRRKIFWRFIRARYD